MQYAQEEPVPPSHRTELHIPREIDEFVLACLRKDPKRRPASAEELLQMARMCKTADLWDQRGGPKMGGSPSSAPCNAGEGQHAKLGTSERRPSRKGQSASNKNQSKAN